MPHTIVIIEDEIEIADIVSKYILHAGFDVKIFYKLEGALAWIKKEQPSLLVLDINLPDGNGIEFCQALRQFSDIQIIMTTAKAQEVDRIVGLNSGADDYLCKPFSPKELLARIESTIRRLDRKLVKKPQIVTNELSFNILFLDKTTPVTAIEFKLFNLLFKQPGRIYSRNQIIDLVYHDYRELCDRTIDSHIRKLRKKLVLLTGSSDVIHSIYGAGYKYEPF